MRLSHFGLLLLAPAALLGCATPASPELTIQDEAAATELQLPAGVTLRRVAGDVWVHTTLDESGEGANGLLIVGETTSTLIYTGWTEAQTRALMRWAAEEQFRPIESAVVTHAHPDRMGGIKALLEKSITVVAVSTTAEQARSKMLPEPTEVFEGARRLPEVDLFFPGWAHAPDNIVVWLAEKRILFAGCAIRSATSDTLGEMDDANLESWYQALKRLQERYPSPRLIIPGHGKPGGPELYKHTLQLIAARGGAVRGR